MMIEKLFKSMIKFQFPLTTKLRNKLSRSWGTCSRK